jgi:hypothetical protein
LTADIFEIALTAGQTERKLASTNWLESNTHITEGRFGMAYCNCPSWLLEDYMQSDMKEKGINNDEWGDYMLIFGGVSATQDYNDIWLISPS